MRPSPDICRRLTAIGALADDAVGLTETALILAAASRPGSDAMPYERHLEKLTDDVAAYVGADADDPVSGLEMRTEALRQVMVKRYGYAGSDDAYDDPDCANLMRVIDRRQGLPVTLGIVALHIARALGWHMEGLDFPPRFLVRMEFEGRRAILDVFDGCIELTPPDLRGLYKAVSGAHVEISPSQYTAMSNRDILLRAAAKVKIHHLRSERLDEALDTIKTMLLFAPENAPLWREAGILYARLDRIPEAIAALEEFLRHAEGEPSGDTSRYKTSVLLQELRERLN
ncbi:MAG: tetratricopeptide repeat protein [Rhodospirillaceae bacterium]|jgi:regulator of sirC expression with transglutaminase-like and TPR domain|nr:tetratricopeptide repeat protein [Rhodospirillaceae bacterium]MBT4218637.1 tetratricopeptide repeat protein [Rhodospirillaceae bacterium]MBT4465022.1 tetratricopeptide repeat protein [Rhodospirillaceae bacterium]MBT5014551.1 tetratricopeptide repeat protein [Rhodospirillaceae bacterium]MBT5308443.1 tetratricopeptide repeat protein [Rhodospirillaceae bacterium]